MSSSTMRQRSNPPSAATVGGGSGKARAVQGSGRQLHASREIFFAGFPCQQPYQRSTASPSAPVNSNVRPLSKQFVRGFFQQYGAVESIFYDAARGMGSVVFVDGADAESCYLAVHLSFLPATTADGGIGEPTWTTDTQGEALADRQARANDVLLCLEFAHCCPFVNPVLLTKDVFVDGGSAHCEVPGADLSRGTLFHRFPQLLSTATQARPLVPVAPHVVVRWQDEFDEQGGRAGGGGGGSGRDRSQQKNASRVEVIGEEEEEAEDEKEKEKENGGATTSSEEVPKATGRVARMGPFFPGRGIEPVELEEALWRLLRPAHIPAASGNVVTVLDLWWEYFNVYMVHKTQPSEARLGNAAYRYAQRPSPYQELMEVHRLGREYAHGDEAAAQQVLQRLVHDHQFHNTLTYLLVKQKFKYDPVWASVMRDLYRPAAVLQLEAWQSLVEEPEPSTTATAPPPPTPARDAVPEFELRRRRVVMKAIGELHEAPPTKPRDVEWVRRAEQTWFSMPRTVATANVMENVAFLGKVKRGEVNRDGTDKDRSKRPTQHPAGGLEGEAGEADMPSAYPSMSRRQREEQFYAEVMQNLDGYAGNGTAEELVALCEDPKLFRYAKGHLGYEEAHHLPSYWRAYINALWVPLIALLLLGYTSYYIVDRLGISKVNEKMRQEEERREFHTQLRRFLEQQQRLMDATTESANNATETREALRSINATMQKAAEAARKAGGRFNIELRGDL